MSLRALIADVDWAEYRRALAALVPLVFAAVVVGWTVGEVTARPAAPPRPPAAVAGVGEAEPEPVEQPSGQSPELATEAGWPAGQHRQPVAWRPTPATTPAEVDEAVEHDPQAEAQPSPTAGPDTTPTPDGQKPEPDESPTSQPQPSTDPDDDGQDEDPAQARQDGTQTDGATPLDPLTLRQIR